jgi:hypothetical protein
MAAEKVVDFEDEDDFELEIEDDTPEEDRGRTRASDSDTDDDEIDDEEMKQFSSGAAKRIKTLTRQKHDQRRLAEAKERELQAAAGEINRLRSQLQGAAKSVVGASKGKLEGEISDLKKQLAEAIETGDGAKVGDLTEKIATTRSQLDGALHAEKRLEQTENDGGGNDQVDPNDRSKWPKARQRWAAANEDWFHKDEEMTGYVYGLHQKLIKNGVEPDSEEYYQKIDKKMKTVFADYFEGKNDDEDHEDEEDDEEEKPRRPQRAESRAAPVNDGGSRGSGGGGKKKVYKLKQSQLDLCKRLNITPKQYIEEQLQLGKNND